MPRVYRKSFSESFKIAYAMSLVSQLGFYIAIPFVAAIAGHNYLDKYILDRYFIPSRHNIHLIIDFVLAFAVGVYSIWHIRRLMLPFMDND